VNALAHLLPLLGATFEKPTTKDFVFGCWGPSGRIFGQEACYNFVYFLFTLAFLGFLLIFLFAFWRPKVVPGKFQLLMESGLSFVRNQIVLGMIGPEGLRFLPFLATFFFFILLGNMLEVTPGIFQALNSHLAFPVAYALISWAVYNYVGIRKHGFFGFYKMVMFPPGAPWLIYVLLAPIELLQVLVVRPLTLSVRLFANMVAGHFLLAVFFGGALALVTGVPYLLGVVSFGMGTVMIGFEIFVAGLQAFIFSVLSASYLAGALAEEH
jgi:F-type H+-transporting ATPase subunit a